MSYIPPSGLLVDCEFGDAYVPQSGLLLTGDFLYAGATTQTLNVNGTDFLAFGTATMLRGFTANSWDSATFGDNVVRRDQSTITFTGDQYSAFGTAYVDFALRTLSCSGTDFARVWDGYTPRTPTEPASGVRHAALVLTLAGMPDNAMFGSATFELKNRAAQMTGSDAAGFGAHMIASQTQFAGSDHATFGAPEIGHYLAGELWCAGADFSAVGAPQINRVFGATGDSFAAFGSTTMQSVLSASGSSFTAFGEPIVLYEYACTIWRMANVTVGDTAQFGTATVTT